MTPYHDGDKLERLNVKLLAVSPVLRLVERGEEVTSVGHASKDFLKLPQSFSIP